MDYQLFQSNQNLNKPVNLILWIGLFLIISAWFFFERNACELVAFIHNSGRLLSARPDMACRLLSLTY